MRGANAKYEAIGMHHSSHAQAPSARPGSPPHATRFIGSAEAVPSPANDLYAPKNRLPEAASYFMAIPPVQPVVCIIKKSCGT
jgi:hypothetical protein